MRSNIKLLARVYYQAMSEQDIDQGVTFETLLNHI